MKIFPLLIALFASFTFGKDGPLNPAEFQLSVRVISYAEHSEKRDLETQCRDTSIPGPYPKTTQCTELTNNMKHREINIEIGNTAYSATCDCDPLAPGEYRGRWKDENHLEILSADNRGVLKAHRFRILAASQISRRSSIPDYPCNDRATVEITSSPIGADIFVDAQFSGSTPSSLEITQGDHSIALQKRGFKKWERSTRIAGSRITLSAELERVE